MTTTITRTETTETIISDARAILRCHNSKLKCKRAHLAEFTTTTTTRAYEGRPVVTRTVTWGGHEHPYRDRYDLNAIIARDFTCATCGHHGATFAVVQGNYSESVKCGGRCRSAVGASCDCQCAGANHGSDHSRV